MWHVSSRSGAATLRTAIHLLLTYLLTEAYLLKPGPACVTLNRVVRRDVVGRLALAVHLRAIHNRLGYDPYTTRSPAQVRYCCR